MPVPVTCGSRNSSKRNDNGGEAADLEQEGAR